MFAQDYGNNAETLKLCTTLQTNSFSSNLDADTALDRILEVVGLSKNFVLAPCSDINNAVAVSFKGVRYILYDPEFMSMLSRNTSNWTNLFILAHEVGHHVNGHSLDLVLYAGEIVDAPELKKKREQELEADEFAGFVLAKLGASLTQTTSSVSKLSNDDDTYSTHPSRDKRERKIIQGWKRASSERTVKTVYIDSDTEKYDRSKSYNKYGNWYTKVDYDVFEGTKVESLTSGTIVGNSEAYKSPPNIIFQTEINSQNQNYLIYLDVSFSDLFPESKIDERKRWLDKDIIEMLWRTYYFGDFEYLHKRFLIYNNDYNCLLKNLSTSKYADAHPRFDAVITNSNGEKIFESQGIAYVHLYDKKFRVRLTFGELGGDYPYNDLIENPYDVRNFIRKLKGGSKLLIRFKNYNQGYPYSYYLRKQMYKLYTDQGIRPILTENEFYDYIYSNNVDDKIVLQYANAAHKKLFDPFKKDLLSELLSNYRPKGVSIENTYFSYSLIGSSKALSKF